MDHPASLYKIIFFNISIILLFFWHRIYNLKLFYLCSLVCYLFLIPHENVIFGVNTLCHLSLGSRPSPHT